MFDKPLEEIAELLIQKNADYGNAWQELATITVSVRIMDKVRRYANLVKCEDRKFENIDDTLRDIVGYALLGLLWLDETVPTIGQGHFGLQVKEVSLETLHKQFDKIRILADMKLHYYDASSLLMCWTRNMLQVVDTEKSTTLGVDKAGAETYLAGLAYICLSLLLDTSPNDNVCVNDGTFEVL